MPFSFKLSVRLALMKAATVLAAAAVCAACKLQARTDPNPPNAVVQVFTSPDSVVLDPYQTQQFRVYGRNEAGDSVAVTVQWSASGGTVTAGGLYVSDTTAGTYLVTATAMATAV